MNISEFTVPCFVSPFLMRIQVPQSHIVNDCVIYKRVPVNANLHIHFSALGAVDDFSIVGNVVLFDYVECGEFFNHQQIV